MKLIFLDIDGVLNCEEQVDEVSAPDAAYLHLVNKPDVLLPTDGEILRAARVQALFPQDRPHLWVYRMRHIDPEKVRLVAEIVEKTGAKIVISSSWRKLHPPAALNAMLSEFGLQPDAVIGETLHSMPPTREGEVYGHEPRGHFIRAYLETYEREHGEVTHYAILDDDDRMAMLKHKLVRTSYGQGITFDHVRRVLLHLGHAPKTH